MHRARAGWGGWFAKAFALPFRSALPAHPRPPDPLQRRLQPVHLFYDGTMSHCRAGRLLTNLRRRRAPSVLYSVRMSGSFSPQTMSVSFDSVLSVRPFSPEGCLAFVNLSVCLTCFPLRECLTLLNLSHCLTRFSLGDYLAVLNLSHCLAPPKAHNKSPLSARGEGAGSEVSVRAERGLKVSYRIVYGRKNTSTLTSICVTQAAASPFRWRT